MAGMRVGRVVAIAVLCILFLTTMRLQRTQPAKSLCLPQQMTTIDLAKFASTLDDEDSALLESYYSAAAKAATSATPTTTVNSSTISTSSTSQTPTAVSTPIPKLDDSGNAYVFYASSTTYACSVLINIHRLQHDFQTKYPIYVLVTPDLSDVYIKAFEDVGAIVSVHDAPRLHQNSPAVAYYDDCLLKLLSFKMHHFFPTLKRVLMLDADQMIVQELDHVFDMPKTPLAAPRAYWIKRDFISSTFMLIQLSDSSWNLIENAIKHVKVDQYDMDIVNEVFGDTALILPGSYVTMNGHWEMRDLPNWFNIEHVVKHKHSNLSTPIVRRSLHHREEPSPLPADFVPMSSSTSAAASVPTPESPATPVTDDQASIGSLTNSQDQPKSESADPANVDEQAPLGSLQNTQQDQQNAPSPAAPVEATPTQEPAVIATPVVKTLDLAFEALYNATHVLHYSALGKPWSYSIADVRQNRPEAHPLFAEQFRVWRQAAKDLCPPIERRFQDKVTQDYMVFDV